MSGVFTTNLVSFHGGGRSILGTGEHVSTERPDACTALCVQGSDEHIILNIEVQELSSMNRILEGLLGMSWLQWNKRLVSRCFINIKDFIKLSKNITQELEIQFIALSLTLQPDAKQR